MPEGEPGLTPLRLWVVPGRLRWWYWRALTCLLAYGAWLWLEAAGAALVILWCETSKPWQGTPFHLHLSRTSVTSSSVEPWRVALACHADNVEVFRDEVAAADWAALRRLLLEN